MFNVLIVLTKLHYIKRDWRKRTRKQTIAKTLLMLY